MTPKPYLLIFTIGFTSCITQGRYVFRDNTATMPGLTHKGEAVVSGTIASNGQSNGDGIQPYALHGYDLEGAYALSDHWTVQGAFDRRSAAYAGSTNMIPGYDSCRLFYRNTTWEVGASYMWLLRKHVYFAPSFGGGGGVFHIGDREFDTSAHTRDDYTHDSRLLQAYVQPAFLFTWRWMDLGLGMRVSLNHFARVSTNYTADQQAQLSLDNLGGSTLPMSQCFMMLRVYPGTQALRLELRLGEDAYLSSGTLNRYVYFANAALTVGVDPYFLFRRRHNKN
ncbi:hypothetical protein [Dinghuibacter silviterrae]|nr:hypothetical protein [Dinghuibacter silviterrae]